MALTTAQLQTLRTHIDASPDLNTIQMGSDGDSDIAALLNIAASPNFYGWRSTTKVVDVQNAAGFNWTLVDGLSAGRARIWDWMARSGSLNSNQANVRAGIGNAFQGTGQLPAMRLAIFQVCQRLATRFEKLYATGAGTTTDNDGSGPATLVVEGPVSHIDVGNARAL